MTAESPLQITERWHEAVRDRVQVAAEVAHVAYAPLKRSRNLSAAAQPLDVSTLAQSVAKVQRAF